MLHSEYEGNDFSRSHRDLAATHSPSGVDLKNVASGAGIAQPPDVELYYGQSFVGGSLVPLDEATAILRLGLSGSCHDINRRRQRFGIGNSRSDVRILRFYLCLNWLLREFGQIEIIRLNFHYIDQYGGHSFCE